MLFKVETLKGRSVNKSRLARVIGISQVAMSKILNGKMTCKKTTAYCITKVLDENAEINDFFINKKEEI